MRQPRLDAPVPDRLTFIEGMRGIAALYVVLAHFCSMADPRAFQQKPSFAPGWLQTVMAPLWHGHLAVAAFIAISGFCLQMSLFQGKDGRVDSFKRFFARRARRILPPYYACLGISIAIALSITASQSGMPFEQYLPVTWQNVGAHLLLIHNLSAAWMYKINGVLWSISAEAQLYLLFPLLVWMVARLGRNLSVVLTALASFALLIEVPASVKLYPWYLALFTIGIAAAHLSYRPVLQLGVKPRLGLILTVAFSVGCVYAVVADLAMPISDGLIALTCASLMYSGSVAPTNLVARTLGCKPLAWLGAISYSLYLMHHPIQQIVYVLRPASVQGEASVFLYLLAVGLPVILAGCTIFWFFFERPFVKKPRQIQKTALVHAPVMPTLAYVADEQRMDAAVGS